MDNLRLVLLVIGCLSVLGIYLWEILRNKEPKKRADILNAVDETPDTPISSISTNDIANDSFSHDALADLGSLLTQSRNQTVDITDSPEPLHVSTSETTFNDDEDEESLPLEMSVNDYEASINEENKPDVFAAIEERQENQTIESAFPVEPEPEEQEEIVEEDNYELELEPNETDVPESNKATDDLLVLYITSPSHISFNGLSISKAADEVGMIYGHMNIFHHFGPGKLHSGQPLFSLANMHEPGSFDLGRMSDLKTKGLAIFMYSPASIDASVVFELFLNTTQRLAELLGGTVRTVDNSVLNNASIKTLREKAEALTIN
jgi:cell division protein ZipA